jgi:hypothetical protein
MMLITETATVGDAIHDGHVTLRIGNGISCAHSVETLEGNITKTAPTLHKLNSDSLLSLNNGIVGGLKDELGF